MTLAASRHWQSVAALPDLGPDDIHLWQFSLQKDETPIDDLQPLLSQEEIARAGRLIRPVDGMRFMLGRVRLRQLLGGYLASDPSALKLTTLPQGKPVLAEPALSFNLSHSGDLALLAITRTLPLGVDLEQLRPELDWKPLAKRYFSPREQLTLQDLPPDQQNEAFFTIWTRKEAWLKASGCGFHLPFDKMEVSSPPAPAALLHYQTNPTTPGEWLLEDIPMPGDYCATLAYPAPRRKILLLKLDSGQHGPGLRKKG